MEVTIHIPNEEYKELTDRQRTGLAELMQLESARVMTGEEPEKEKKPKRQRKAKAEGEPDAAAVETTKEEEPKPESTPATDEPKAEEPEEPPVPEEPQAPPEPELSINDIARAGAAYITKHPTDIPKMQEIFKQFGIEKITDLKNIPDKVPSFVEAVRALGVEI